MSVSGRFPGQKVSCFTSKTRLVPPLRGISQAGKMRAMKPTTDQSLCREIFGQAGLRYGRSFGSKSNYLRANPTQFYIANACVVSTGWVCLWRGDLDLADKEDRQALIRASRTLGRKLFIFRQEVGERNGLLPRDWLAKNAVAAVWRGTVETVGNTQALRGTLEQIVKGAARIFRTRRGSSLPPRQRVLDPEHQAMMSKAPGDHIRAALDEIRGGV